MKSAPKLTFDIRETAEILVPDRLGRLSYLISLGVAGLMLILITLLLSRTPPVVPFYFTLPWGEARLAARVMLYLLPVIAIAVAGINIALGKLAGKLSPLLPKVLSVTSMVVSIMLLLSLMGILQSLVL